MSIEKPILPPPLQQEQPNPLRFKEAETIKTPKKLSAKEASKEHLSKERMKLVQDIRKERSENERRLRELKARLAILESQLSETVANIDREKLQIQELAAMRAEQATTLAGRVRKLLDRIGIHQQTDTETSLYQTEQGLISLTEEKKLLEEEKEGLNLLLEDDSAIEIIRKKIASHYETAEGKAQSEYEDELKTVQQTMMRNGVFVVHTIEENPELRHNLNSNVSKDATFDDDLKILLSLEPSISASSVKTGISKEGKVSGLWSHSGGVLIGRGEIKKASAIDAGTVSQGIKQRSKGATWSGVLGGEKISDIDATVSEQRADIEVDASGSRMVSIGEYNELVIDNPKIFGFFKPADVDQNGNFWIYNERTKKSLEELHQLYNDGATKQYTEALEVFNRNLNRYRDKMNVVKSMGIPIFIMTPDRRILECLEINDSGQVIVGKEIKPEDVTNGKSGIVLEDRKRIGKELLTKKIFKYERTREEAKDIIQNL